MLAADPSPWRFQAHPEIWVLLGALVGLAWYAVHVVGPRALGPDVVVVTRRQKGFFVAALALLWLASDWPMHDIAEEYLLSVHMVQHLLLTLVVPPLVLFATPVWLARLVVGDGAAWRWFRRFAHPVVAGVLFNLLVALSHWAPIVNNAVQTGPFHYTVHLILFSAALLMWTPVCGPFPELRLSLPGQMVYLFAMSILPTIPAAWLTFAEGTLYEAYDKPFRLWGMTIAEDQQMAGLIMKIIGGLYLWSIITVLFFKWAARHAEADRQQRTVSEREVLTWAQVEEAFAGSNPPVEVPPAAPN